MTRWQLVSLALATVACSLTRPPVPTAAPTSDWITVSYYWPTAEHADPLAWNMLTPSFVDIAPSHGTREQRRFWQRRGKKILCRVAPAADRNLFDVMEEATTNECDGVAIDEITLGKADAADVERQLERFRQRHRDDVILVYVADALQIADPTLVSALYRSADFVVPEIYRSEGDRIDFERWKARYVGSDPVLRHKTLIGIGLYPTLKRTPAGWLPYLEREIAAVKALGFRGVVLVAPCYLQDQERPALDDVIRRVTAN
jgi:hypothetical protein